MRFIHFHFQLVEKFEHVENFQLIEINFQFVENVKFLAITLHNLLTSALITLFTTLLNEV